MNVVVIASEAVPLAKTGGLADVAGALPRALERLGHSACLFLPCYPQVRKSGLALSDTGLTLRIPIGPRAVEGFVRATTLPESNVTAYLIDQPHYFDRDRLYDLDGRDYHDQCERFVFFQRAVLETIRRLALRPDVLHCNDWQTGLVPVYLDELYRDRPGFGALGTLYTIHNLAYQGWFPRQALALSGLDERLFHWQALEHHDQLNFMKAGLVFADMVSTVSPTYAREIQTDDPELNCGLQGLLRARGADLRGIVNGIDVALWDPSREPMLAQRYDSATVVAGKAACKAQLQRRASLPERPETPLFAQIGRLVPQKGWDLLAAVADDFLRRDVQLVVLGTGQSQYYELLNRLASAHPGKVRAFLDFDEALSHQIEAGADLYLMPSLYEPCGLNQMYSLAHGTVPIVHATGGLADTVVDATPAALADDTATGFAFTEMTPEGLRDAIGRASALWPDRDGWLKLMRAGMREDFSWERSALSYVALYEEVRRRGRANEHRHRGRGLAI